MESMKNLLLRRAVAADAPAISALILDLAPFMTLREDGVGAEQFLLNMAPGAIEGHIGASNVDYRVAWLGDELAGVVAVRERKHVLHLFVARAQHGRGLARRLWDAARKGASNPDGFTVNSSRHALPMYRHFGFEASGPCVERAGIAYIPMRLAPPPAAD